MYRASSAATVIGQMMMDCGVVKSSSTNDFSTRFRRSPSPTPTNTSDVRPEYNRTVEYFDVDEESLECGPVHVVLWFFNEYYIPFIILIGFVGNILSCVVFLGTHLKMRSSSYYLAALATADFGFLLALLLVWLNYSIGWQVFNKSGWCECLVYLSAVCSSLSVWLIVAFTVERFIAVQYPFHRPSMCTISRAKTIVVALVVLALASHSYAFVMAGVSKTPDGVDLCQLNKEYWDAMKVISTVDSVASLIAPLVLIVVMNTMITRNLLKFGKKFKYSPGISGQCNSRDKSDINLNRIPSGSSSNKEVENIALGNISGRRPPTQPSCPPTTSNSAKHSGPRTSTATPVPSTPRNVQQIPDITAQCIHVGSSSRNLASARNQRNITKMLLLISTVFILLNLPSYVIRLCIFFFTLTQKDNPPPSLLGCVQQFTMLLYYTNFSINFLLYAMCGVTFRRCLDQLLRKTMKNITRYLERERRDSETM